ncbi:aldo/keto reductase [Bifidobacterium simiiventris]|uniref:aldo/keto reductase n=1 Tax=Bifidobacterium simiiventris TaxID=2834434 RepID=UPI001C591CE9|nr:aldo/keto reductase [Bifidobacterium simiiventris]MBW3079084.1 aldo/keto reductase [Bifidobacterium simiiventris]
MQYGSIPGVSVPASRVVFGTAFGMFLDGNGDPSALLDHAVEAGINVFDCAKEYGHAQDQLGRWLERRGDRDRLIIETKGCHPAMRDGRVVDRVTKRDLDADLAQSLEQLRTPYIDVYLLHRDDPRVPAGEIVEWLNEHCRAGEIRAFGVSNWTVARIHEANEYARLHDLQQIAVSSPNFSLAVQERNPWMGVGETIAGPEHAADRAWYRQTGMPVFAFSVLGRGLMSGRFRSDDRAAAKRLLDGAAREGFLYDDNLERLHRAEILAKRLHATVPQIAIAWALHQGMNLFALASCSSPAIIDANAAATEIELTADQAAWLNLETGH